MRNLMIILIILVSLSLNAQRTTLGFYKIGVYEVDAEEFYPVTDTAYTLINGQVRFVGRYVTFDWGDTEYFYTVVETTIDGPRHSHVLWSTRETIIAHWTEGGSIITVMNTKTESKYSNTLLVLVYHLTKTTETRGNNKYPNKGEIKIISPKKKEVSKSIY